MINKVSNSQVIFGNGPISRFNRFSKRLCGRFPSFLPGEGRMIADLPFNTSIKRGDTSIPLLGAGIRRAEAASDILSQIKKGDILVVETPIPTSFYVTKVRNGIQFKTLA